MTPAPRPHLSVVVPAFNEAPRLGGPLRRIARHLERQPGGSEIVLVDDGSSDATFELIRREGEQLGVAVRAFRYARNRGKGHALKVGFEQARGERVLFTDADLATPIEEAARLLETLDRGYDVAIGSRKLPESEIRVHQPRLRETLGEVFTWLVRQLVADVSDATCGFKAFRAEAGRDLFARSRIHGWAFDAEILYLARRLGYRLAEVPVPWEDRAGTKVRIARDVASSLFGLARIGWNAVSGAYRRTCPVDVRLETWSTRSEVEEAPVESRAMLP